MRILLILIIILFSEYDSLASTGFEVGGTGGRAIGMAGAFIGLADDPSAVWWNPAGLGQLDDRKEFLITNLIDIDQKIGGRSLMNVKIPERDSDFIKVYDIEPDEFTRKKFTMMFREDSFVYYIGKIDGYSLAVSLLGSSGTGFNWKESNLLSNRDIIDAKFFHNNFSMNSTLTIAREIYKDLYWGINLNLIFGRDLLIKRKYYTNGGDSTFKNYTFFYRQDGDGIGFSPDLGILYKLNQKISIGFIIRGSYTLRFKGDAEFLDTTLNARESSGVTQKSRFPFRYGIGIAYKPIDKLVLTANFYRAEWSHFSSDTYFDKEGVFLKNRGLNYNLRDIIQTLLGIEYKLKDNIAIRGGFKTEPSFHKRIINPSFEIPRLNSSRSLTIGFGYKWKYISLDLIHRYSFSKPLSINNERFDENFWLVGMGIGYVFH